MFAPRLTGLARVLLAIGALAGVTMLAMAFRDDATLVQRAGDGNRLIEQALAPGGCAQVRWLHPDRRSDRELPEVTRLRPSDSDGFAFRGSPTC